MARWEMEPKEPPPIEPLAKREWPQAFIEPFHQDLSAKERWTHREYAPQPQLGDLSKTYESGDGGPGTVSHGDRNNDPGGVSYGTYQLSSTAGSARAFVDWLQGTHPDYYEALQGMQPGTAAFNDSWRAIAAMDPDGFGAAQHEYIRASHYDPAQVAIEDAVPGLRFDDRSGTLRDVLWSTAVQHGPGRVSDEGRTSGALDVFVDALAGRDVANMTDDEIISAVYGQRGLLNGEGHLARFPRADENWQAGLTARFEAEEQDALARLADERRVAEALRAQDRARGL